MSKNFWGKALLGAQKLGQAVGDAASDAAAATKKAAKISILKAEMNGIEEKIGQAVYTGGLTPDNAEAAKLLAELVAKHEELEKVQKEAEESDHENCTDPECECDCHDGESHCDDENCNCDCACHDEKNLNDKDLKSATPVEVSEDETNVLSDEDKEKYGNNENTDFKSE